MGRKSRAKSAHKNKTMSKVQSVPSLSKYIDQKVGRESLNSPPLAKPRYIKSAKSKKYTKSPEIDKVDLSKLLVDQSREGSLVNQSIKISPYTKNVK